MRVLVIEDTVKLAVVVVRALQEEGHLVEVAHDGERGCQLLCTQPYDLAIVDLILPGLDGFEVIRRARDGGTTAPILIITARDAVPDRVRGLDSGADDYLVKPFAVTELKARVRALLRRGKGSPILKLDEVALDPARRRVTRGQEEVVLTAREFALLEFFLRRQGEVLTRTTIGEHVWDTNFESFSNVIDVYVNYLRKKLDRPGAPSLITTVRGVGYRMG